MPSYHYGSYFGKPYEPGRCQEIAGMALLPLRTRTNGPAQARLEPLAPNEVAAHIDSKHPSFDIADGITALFRADILVNTFEFDDPADRTLIYGILFISQLFTVLKPKMPRRDAERAFLNLALDNNPTMPGDARFPLNNFYQAPSPNEATVLRQYLMQLRQELAGRMLDRLYSATQDRPEEPNPHWVGIAKRRLMGKTL